MKETFILLASVLFLFSCSHSHDHAYETKKQTQPTIQKVVTENEKIQVNASIVPLASIVNYIGGEEVEVNSIIPVGVSPHGFDLQPQDMVSIKESDIVFLLGMQEIDGFLFKALSGVKSISLDEGLRILKASEHDHDEEMAMGMLGDAHREGHVHAETLIDSHVWTGKVNTLLIAQTITKELSDLKPSKKEFFEKQYEMFAWELEKVFSEFKASVKEKKQKEFIVFHDAYNYLFHDLGINQEKKLVFRENVMSQPDSADMKELTDKVKLHGLNVFFREPQFKDTALETFASKHNAQIFVLDPLGEDDSASGYFQNLKQNLEVLKNIYE